MTPSAVVFVMSLETVITLTAATCEILIFLGGVVAMIYHLGTFKATTTERLRALTERFDLAHSQNNQEINELKTAVGRVISDVSMLREDRVRLNRIEEEVREIRREQHSQRLPA